MNSKQESNRRYYEKNKERIKKEATAYYWKNRDERIEANKAWRLNNKPRVAELTKRWRANNRARLMELNSLSKSRQRKRNPSFRKRLYWRSRMWRVFVKGTRHPGTLSVLGCSAEQFKAHIYSQLHSGMTTENYAELWELDHIKPCYQFDCTNEEQLRACFHYTNYRPRLKVENQWHPKQKHETQTQHRLAGRA